MTEPKGYRIPNTDFGDILVLRDQDGDAMIQQLRSVVFIAPSDLDRVIEALKALKP